MPKRFGIFIVRMWGLSAYPADVIFPDYDQRLEKRISCLIRGFRLADALYAGLAFYAVAFAALRRPWLLVALQIVNKTIDISDKQDSLSTAGSRSPIRSGLLRFPQLVLPALQSF